LHNKLHYLYILVLILIAKPSKKGVLINKHKV